MAYYDRPNWFLRRVANPALQFVVSRLGLGQQKTYILEVKGRKTGEPRQVPVNILNFEGRSYLVAPRGATEWVRNLRTAGEGALLRGGERTPITAIEVPVSQRAPILKRYLHENSSSAGAYFDVRGAEAPISEFERIAEKHPVFVYTTDTQRA